MNRLHSLLFVSLLAGLVAAPSPVAVAAGGHGPELRQKSIDVADARDRGDRGDRQRFERRDGMKRGNVERPERMRESRPALERHERVRESRPAPGSVGGMMRRATDRSHPRGYVLDRRYHHDRYYPPRGYVERALPRGYRVYHHHGDRYYYRQGIWYHRSALGFVVVTPPFGIIVPVLPPYYTTIWVGGVPYYYAGGVYYVWRPAMQGYVVAEPPAESSVATPSKGPDRFYVYPKNGQSEEQQAQDRYECHRWAVGQTGFDPSRSPGDLTEAQLVEKRGNYRRAIGACLDARGYSVK